MNTELPPRTRRIHWENSTTAARVGTTSAYAENTPAPWASIGNPWNYLRVRGEYHINNPPLGGLGELPPRTRRILGSIISSGYVLGTTSAYAENTSRGNANDADAGNYLRVRGEYTPPSEDDWGHVELPPRTRRILNNWCKILIIFRTTSAYAENTAYGFQ